MKISKVCGTDLFKGCFSKSDVVNLRNGSFAGSFETTAIGMGYKVITADGMSIIFGDAFGDNDIYVDIDGPKNGKNQMGTDLFLFSVDPEKNMLYPAGQWGYFSVYTSSDVSTNTFIRGRLAAYWIIQNDNADYLKADSTGKCNNSDIILDWTTNTSCH